MDRLLCPSCGREVQVRQAIQYRDDTLRPKRLAWLSIVSLGTLVLVIAGFVYRSRVRSGFDLLEEAVGSASLAWASLAGGFFLLFVLMIWLCLPLFLYIWLRTIRRRLREVEETTKLCARHLARLTTAPGPSAEKPLSEPKQSGPSSSGT